MNKQLPAPDPKDRKLSKNGEADRKIAPPGYRMVTNADKV